MPEEKLTTGQAGIPDEVYDFIDDLSAIDRIEALIARHHLSNAKLAFHELNAVPDAIALGKMKPGDIAGDLARTLKLEPAAAEALARDTVADLLGPVAKFLPDVERFLSSSEKASAKPKEAAEHPVQQVSANAFVHGELEKYKLELPEEHLQKKFERVLSEFVAKQKTREETLEALTRARKVGGLGLDEHASTRLLDGLLDDAKHIPKINAKAEPDVFSQDTSGSSLQRRRPPAPSAGRPRQDGGPSRPRLRELPAEKTSDSPLQRAPKPKPLPPRTIVKIEDVLAPPVVEKSQAPSVKPQTNYKPAFDPMTMHPDDEKEIEAHKRQVPSVEPLHDIEAMTQKTISAIVGAKELDEEGKKKLHAIVKTRLNGIRDAYKTRAALEAAEGLGWSGGELTQALEEIEKTYGKLEAAGVEKAQREKREYVAKRAARFVSGSSEAEAEADSDVPPQDTDGSSLQRRRPSAPSAAGQRFQKSAGPSPARLRELPAAETSESPLPAQGEPPAPRPMRKREKVRDVVAPRKLSGPVEELEGMTIADFRRLGSTGEEAAAEVGERLKLLEDQSYGLRLKGIAAWRRSPLYETYVSVISEAMQSEGGMEAVLRAHKSAGEEMLTLEEVRALIKLNGILRV